MAQLHPLSSCQHVVLSRNGAFFHPRFYPRQRASFSTLPLPRSGTFLDRLQARRKSEERGKAVKSSKKDSAGHWRKGGFWGSDEPLVSRLRSLRRRIVTRERGDGVRALGLVEVVAAAAATAVLAAPLMMVATAVAGTAALVTGILCAFLVPLIPLTLAAFGLVGFTVPFVWAVLDRFLFAAVAFNFVAGVVGLTLARNKPDVLDSYNKTIPKGIRKWLKREGLALQPTESSALESTLPLKKPFWLTSSILSLIPGLHGASWLVALAEWPNSLPRRWDFRAGLLRNAAVYGGTGLLGLLLGHPFGAPAAVTVVSKASCWGIFCYTAPAVVTQAAVYSSGSFWLSLVLGAAHLQLDRAWLKEISSRREQGSEGVIDVTPGSDASGAEVDLSKKELEDFDTRLRHRTKGGDLGQDASRWSTGEVVVWLNDNGMSDCAKSFIEHDINGAVLLTLTDDELRSELGMKRLGQRRRLLLLVKELVRQQA